MCAPKKEIVVVDDDESFGRAIGRLLKASGFKVMVYPSAEAFLAASEATPDCLVLDVEMRGISGLELQRQLLSVGRMVPAIFVTAHEEPEVREKATELKCAAYFRKPVNGKLLIDEISRLLSETNVINKEILSTEKL